MNLENFTHFMVNYFATVENGMKIYEGGLDIQQFEQPYLNCIGIISNEFFGEEKWNKMQDFMFDSENCEFKTLDDLYTNLFPNENAEEVRSGGEPE